ncbi:hypothetical protein [Hymenobacter cellulosilyticus]|uniref:Uncharacterized protein n=1 Tax=Hymenobacter cellulosilyticus TaxID=2932248 RepID=A0A8T9Q2U8_9BACT|nr:hypothetical protein [Hymenobacter cellulosilyticus]UOQ71854.1 hypothetical protein MUN79_25165 [Hymenobacter cellulosilyticus]
MTQGTLIPTETLFIERVGVVDSVTVLVEPDEELRELGWQRKTTVTPHVLPTQFYMGNKWVVSHTSPTTGQLVEWNWQQKLFRDTRYPQRLCLSTRGFANKALLNSIAALFLRLEPAKQPVAGRIRPHEYLVQLPATRSGLGGFDGTPNLHYYTARGEQYLALYAQRYAVNERRVEGASFVNLYEIVQVRLDEERFLRLIRQALEAAYHLPLY